MKKIVISNSPKQTRQIAQDFIRELTQRKLKTKSALVFILEGELGAGKTEFMKGIAEAFRIKEKINSPTFVLMKVFKLKNKNFHYLWHLDLYRLKKTKELASLGFRDLLEDKKNLVFIEWGEKIEKLLPKKHGKIKIEILDDKQRKINFSC